MFSAGPTNLDPIGEADSDAMTVLIDPATEMEISELKSAVEAISRTQNEMVAQGFVMEDKLAKQAELLATTNSKLDLVLKALKVELPD